MKKNVLRGSLIAAVMCIGAVGAWRVFGWGHLGPVNGLKLDLARPDALVLTRSLAALPRDLLTIPLARDVLREDLVFYYEQGEDRLGLKGTLRRIAYEHDLNWGDRLIRNVLDEPAEVALWRDGNGALRHYAIAVSRGKLARLLEEAGKVALKDSQLRVAGKLRVEGDGVQVYALDYAYGQTLLIAAHGERMVILSHPGMLYGGNDGKRGDKDAQAVVVKLLGARRADQDVLHRQFQLAPGIPAGHSVAVKADWLSFGYQPFFGALQALRFDFSNGHWRSQVLVDGDRLRAGGYDSRALWATLPYDPSACFSVPADWNAMKPVLERLGAKRGGGASALPSLAARLDGPAAACWYGSSRLYTPVFVANYTHSGDNDLLASLFGALVGGTPAYSAAGGVQRWERTLDTPQGKLTPTLALAGGTLVFSADRKLVDAVLAVKRRQAPAASDRLPDAPRTVGLIDPSALARLTQKEAFAALPAASEPVLRGAAEAHLLPRLAALRAYPPYRMVVKTLPAAGVAWQPLEWQAAR